MLVYEGITDKGLKRADNEDNFLMNHDLFVVSDGMGGHDKGEVASEIIINTIKKEIENYNEEGSTVMFGEELDKEKLKQQIIYQINSSIKASKRKIVEYVVQNKITSKIGATVAGIYFDQILSKKVTTFHLGDSRVYRVRDKIIEQLTIDHSMYEDMRRSNKYSEQELRGVSRSVITKAVGNFKLSEAEVEFYDIEPNDIYLICSDGVSDLCSDYEILDVVLNSVDDLKQVCLDIKDLVYTKGARDNLSFIIVKNVD